MLILGTSDVSRAEFKYIQGQHLPLRAEIDRKDVRRTYSICSSVNDVQLRVGIRTQAGGVFSNYVADTLQVGDIIESMPPIGHFNTPLNAGNEKTYVAFLAGSGITPLLSIVKTTLETEQKSRFLVFYGNRKRTTTMFIEELWALKNLYNERLALHFIMSQEPTEISLYGGRIDGEKVALLHHAFLKGLHVDDVFLCGPNSMIKEVIDALTGLDYAPESIHVEHFHSSKDMLTDESKLPQTATTKEGSIKVYLIIDGSQETMHMHADESILDAALRQGIDLPYSCRSGVCSTCRAKLSSGKTKMALNYALEPWELEQGFILTCQAKPTSKTLEVNYDQTGL